VGKVTDEGVVSSPRVSVVVPHYDDLPALSRCLEALERQTFPTDQFEIIVADNNSPQGEAAVAEAIAGRARVIVVTEKGAGAARNGGVIISKGAVIAFTDSDCVPGPRWLEYGVAALAGVDFVGGAMNVSVERPGALTPEEAFESVFAFDNERYVHRLGFTVSANLLCSRSVFDTVGGFLPAGIAEDCDWCHRATDAGFKIDYAPSAVVVHPARRDWAELIKKWRWANGDVFNMVKRRPGGRVLWAARTLFLPISILVHAPKALVGRPAQRVIELTGSRSEIVFRALSLDHPRQRRPDISQAERVLDWKSTAPLREGPTGAIAYFDGLLSTGGARVASNPC
jgi:GT2 family glycosyltransferase